MPQFDVYENPNPQSRDWAPYVVDLQHDMLQSLNTRIMAPLLRLDPREHPMRRLNPIVSIDQDDYFLSTTEMAAVPLAELLDAIANLEQYRGELVGAIDLVFTGS